MKKLKGKKFHEFIYRVENVLDEFVIAVLSFSVILITVHLFFVSSQDVGLVSFGKIIEPWVTMLALMLIARELWIMNLHKRKEISGE